MLGVNISIHCVGFHGLLASMRSFVYMLPDCMSLLSHMTPPPLQYLSLQIKLASLLRRELLMKGGVYKKTVMPLLLYQNQKVAVTMATDRCPDLHAAWKTLPK